MVKWLSHSLSVGVTSDLIPRQLKARYERAWRVTWLAEGQQKIFEVALRWKKNSKNLKKLWKFCSWRFRGRFRKFGNSYQQRASPLQNPGARQSLLFGDFCPSSAHYSYCWNEVQWRKSQRKSVEVRSFGRRAAATRRRSAGRRRLFALESRLFGPRNVGQFWNRGNRRTSG